MTDKTVPFTKEMAESLANLYPTPFHIYDEAGIRRVIRRFQKAFDWVPGGFKNYYAVKACPNPSILKIMKEEGFGADCSSLPELLLAQRVGISGELIMFSSNDTPVEEFRKARELGAVINLDDISHIQTLKQAASLPELICFRYNPGPLKAGNAIIGKPEEAKYGLTREQLLRAYQTVRDKGVKRFGLHTMVASNELDPEYFIETAQMIFALVVEIHEKLGIDLEFVNLGGGIGIPYRPEDQGVDIEYVAAGIRRLYNELVEGKGIKPFGIYMECGRVVTGPHGYLVTKVRHVAHKYKDYVGLDSCMTNLMRPALYGAYHHITVLGKEELAASHTYDVTGSLCENNDKFAINRKLPEIDAGDMLVIHDSGAHGHAMGFNYNGKLRSAELLLREGGDVELIRRAETVDDYFATLRFEGSEWGSGLT